MNKYSLKYKEIINLIFLAIMVTLPEIIAFAPKQVGVALITVFLVLFLINVSFKLKSSFKIFRNNKRSFLEEQAINKDLKNAVAMMIISSLMIGFILIKFIYSSYMLEWWSTWYTKQAMIIWWGAIEASAIITLTFSICVASRKTLAKMIKSIDKLIRKTFALFKKVIGAMINLWKVVLDFAKNVLERITLSNIITSLKYIKDSNIKAIIFKDQFLVTTKKATWPPLF